MKTILFRATESVVGVASCLVLFGGVASAQSIDTTGPDSTNIIRDINDRICKVTNDTDVDVVNNNPQDAESGESSGENNTTVGSVGSGNASNNSAADFNVNITNGAAGCLPENQPTPVTPNEEQPAVTPAAQPVGGRGGGEAQVAPVAQVVVPQGGVGAGSGGQTYFSGLVALTILSGALAATRISRTLKGQLR